MSVKYAYGYVRVSTDKQEELSPDSQEKLLREYAAKNNIVILKIFLRAWNFRQKSQTNGQNSENDRACKII